MLTAANRARVENDMREVDPQSTSRALAFELWMKAPMPMVTLMKTLDVTALVRLSRKRGYQFNMLLCWCIGKAAAGMEDFYLLPVGDKLMRPPGRQHSGGLAGRRHRHL